MVFIFKELQKTAKDVGLQWIVELTNLLKEAKGAAANDYQDPVLTGSVDPDAILPKFSQLCHY